MIKLTKALSASAAALALLFVLAGCEKDGKMEEMGEKADDMMEKAGDMLEDAGDKVEEMGEEAKKKAKEMTE